MRIDQKHVTAVWMQDGREREICLYREGSNYRLSFLSKEEVLNVWLNARDLRKVYQEIGRMERKEIKKELHLMEPKVTWGDHQPGTHEPYSTVVSATPAPTSWNHFDWLSYN